MDVNATVYLDGRVRWTECGMATGRQTEGQTDTLTDKDNHIHTE